MSGASSQTQHSTGSRQDPAALLLLLLLLLLLCASLYLRFLMLLDLQDTPPPQWSVVE
jgi:hypothetical protein